MGWQQLELRLTASDLPRAEALLCLSGAATVSVLPDTAEEIVEPGPGTTPLWASVRVRALFPPESDVRRAAKMLVDDLGTDAASSVGSLGDDDWADALAREPASIRIGARLLLTGAESAIDEADRVRVRLHRGLAFGTGDHPTTRLCLEWLDANLRAGATLIDFGCGSGILAIAALRLGADCVWAVDIEPQALRASADNASLNAVSDRLWLGDPDDLPQLEVDVVLANILANSLVELAARIGELCAPSASLVLGGLRPHQVDAVETAYRSEFCGFARLEREGWACLTATRKA